MFVFFNYKSVNCSNSKFIKPKGDVVINLDEFINCIINAFEVKVV